MQGGGMKPFKKKTKGNIEVPQKGWPPKVIDGLIPTRVRNVAGKYTFDYSFQFDAFVQKMNKFEIERKGYGSLILDNLLIPVLITFVVGEDEETESQLRLLGQEYFTEIREYTGSFCFNTSFIQKDHDEKEVPFLDFNIYLFNHEWDRILESFLLNKLNKALNMRMAVSVEFPEKPDPNNIVDKSVHSSFKISRFWLDSFLFFDGDSLKKNPLFLDDIEF
jgi:hypothetical protein